MSSRILAISSLAAVVLLGSCQSGRQVIKERVIISADDSTLVFYPVERTALTPTFYKQVSKYYSDIYTGVWRNPYGNFPQARLEHLQSSPGIHIPYKYEVDGYVEGLRFGDYKMVKGMKNGRIQNATGLVDYQDFSLARGSMDPIRCVAFTLTFGQSSSDGATAGTDILAGYYCTSPGESLPDKRIAEIVKSVGVKGYGVPKPPAGWRAAKAGSGAGNLVELQFEARWVGFNEQLQGKMFIDLGKRNKGRMWVGLPGKAGECTGEWVYESGKFGTPVLPTGTWSVICTNGLSAEGTYVNSETKKGYGEGKDGDGNSITFTYGS